MLQEYQVWRNTSSKLRSGKHGPGNGLPFREGQAPVVGMLTSPGWEEGSLLSWGAWPWALGETPLPLCVSCSFENDVP